MKRLPASILAILLTIALLSLCVNITLADNTGTCTSKIFVTGESNTLWSEDGLAGVYVGANTLPQGGTVSICTTELVWQPWEAKFAISRAYTVSFTPAPQSDYLLTLHPIIKPGRESLVDIVRFTDVGWSEKMRATPFQSDWKIATVKTGSFAMFNWYNVFLPFLQRK
ncbi:hypothetical protein CO180_01090 [candidate division WWE3 bacterium CG_4_9_14_3_um_filter_41_6]|nr:MAG: hypothetical protein CO180_01090 [candidate division WWE3 bacterium CG_4_9_14_3_um_filter_41_6]